MCGLNQQERNNNLNFKKNVLNYVWKCHSTNLTFMNHLSLSFSNPRMLFITFSTYLSISIPNLNNFRTLWKTQLPNISRNRIQDSNFNFLGQLKNPVREWRLHQISHNKQKSKQKRQRKEHPKALHTKMCVLTFAKKQSKSSKKRNIPKS